MTEFSVSAAVRIEVKVAGSRHDAYEDDAGNICLESRSRHPKGGVAVSQAAIEWMQEQNCSGRFVRLINLTTKFHEIVPLDAVLPLDWLPYDEPFAIIKPDDLLIPKGMEEVPF